MFEIKKIIKTSRGKLLQGEKSVTVRGVSINSRTVKKGDLFIAIKGANYDGHDFISEAIKKGACSVLVSKKIKSVKNNIPVVLVRDTVISLGLLAQYWRKEVNPIVIAVTGSNGKTTTKDLIHAVLRQKLPVLKNELTQNNNIGLPLNLLKLKRKHKVAVLELGTNHPGEIAYLSKIANPDIGIITNIGYAHLANLNNLNTVLKEKVSLFNHLREKSICILNRDDSMLNKAVASKPFYKKGIVITCGIKRNSDFKASSIRIVKEGISFKVGKNVFFLKTPAEHNIYNALIAIACGRILGVEITKVKKGLKGFVFPKGRFNVLKFNNIRLIDDTYNANPVSVKNALDVFSCMKCQGKRIFVFGDMLELGKKEAFFHSLIGKKITQLPIDIFVCIGKMAGLSGLQAIKEGIDKNRVFIFNKQSKAKKTIKKMICQKDLVLFKGSRKMGLEKIIEYIKK